ncbi:uncharacterized protein LOC111823314 isoform X3 [Myotis lucifugus]|uniref:uncharacterized protein LOC111823314 isoform X3 n=1 Tax=Myotis lucifugus TaxID=59463 RepID=UPI000CCC35A2|nr:uncharacterized protein LOC111823314 isoform X3 [Myotis lucifugus]
MCVGSVSDRVGLCALDMGAGLLLLLLLVGRPSCCRLSRVRVHAASHRPVPPSRSRCSRDRRGRGHPPGDPGTWSGGWVQPPGAKSHTQDRAGQGEGATRRRSRGLDRIQVPCRTAQRSLLENRSRGSQFLPSASPVQLIP